MSPSIRRRCLFILLICQYMSLTWCTRLPLEVYELTPNTVPTTQTTNTAKTTTTTKTTSTATATNINEKAQHLQHHYLFKHKNFEYSIIEPQHDNQTFSNSDKSNNTNNNNKNNHNATTTTTTPTIINDNKTNGQPLDRRRSRQMIDIAIQHQKYETSSNNMQQDHKAKATATTTLQHHNEHDIQQQQQQQQHNYHNAGMSLYLQKLHQHYHQQQLERHRLYKDHSNSNNNNNNNSNQIPNYNNNNNNNKRLQQNHGNGVDGGKYVVHGRNVRVLYQVGDSEDDLPICAPNAVCSKIDLYETPWLERQCRCPEFNRVVHYHRNNEGDNNDDHDNDNDDDDDIEIFTGQYHSSLKNNQGSTQQPQRLTHAEKMRSYYEKEKIVQHNKRLLVTGDYNDKKFESLHLKKLMQKLGAVYEDELHIQPHDYLAAQEAENNDALPLVADNDDFEDNEFPHGTRHSESSAATPSATNSAHMRHSGHSAHSGHKAKDITFIGGCPSSLGIEDGHTIADKTRHYKLCQPVHKLPVCKHFRDYTWTLTTSNELNITEQIVHCRCPKNSVTYLTKREPAADGLSGYTYLFACSPLTRIRCQRKQPCKLFTVRKRQEFLDEVNINALCQCPKGHRCPSHHTQSGVIAGESFLEDNIQTYSGYCMAND